MARGPSPRGDPARRGGEPGGRLLPDVDRAPAGPRRAGMHRRPADVLRRDEEAGVPGHRPGRGDRVRERGRSGAPGAHDGRGEPRALHEAAERAASRARPVLVRVYRKEQGRGPRFRPAAREVQGPAACAPHPDVSALRPHRWREHAALRPVQRGLHRRGPGALAGGGLRRHREAPGPAPPHVTDVHQPLAGERGLRGPRPRQPGAGDVRHRGDAGEHAGQVPPDLPSRPLAADLRPLGSRHPAIAVPLVRFALGQGGGRRVRDPCGRRHAGDR